MANTISPNMNLIIPGVGTEAGPTYAFDVNSSLTLIDQHDHSPGKGVQISSAGINIDADFSLNTFNLIDSTAIVFTASLVPSTIPQSLSVAPGGEAPPQQDLWFTPNTGVPIQITKNGIVNVVASSIPGESYAAGTFFWTQTQDGFPTTPANFDIGSITIRPNVALTTFGVTLQPNSGISSQYSLTLPLLPATTNFMLLDSSGNITAPWRLDNVTIGVVANLIKVLDGSIGNTQITDNSISGVKIVNHDVGLLQLGTSVLQTNTITFPQTTFFTVRAATTVNGALASAFDNASVIDGVTLATGDLILIKNQTTSSDDGVYTVQASGAPVRHASYDTFTELNYASISVTLGTANAGTKWYQNNILTSLASNQSWSTTFNTFTIPANVNTINIKGIGGGGGGGGGGSDGGGGAGGGAGAIGDYPVTVVPGDVLTISIGTGGVGGTRSVNGTSGTNTTITGSGVSITLLGGGGGGCGADSAGRGNKGLTGVSAGGPGGTGGTKGGGGGGGGSLAPGGNGQGDLDTVVAQYSIDGSNGSGGGGGNSRPGSPAAAGQGGANVYTSARSTGGNSVIGATGWGGGGGGGSGFAVGGNGSNGSSSSSSAGGTAAAQSGAGGGGSGSSTSSTTGQAGTGGSGKVTITWVGAV